MSELNLIPYELKAKRAKVINTRRYISYGIIAFCVFVAIVIVPKGYLMYLDSKENKIDNKISNNSKIVVEDKKLQTDIENYKAYNDKVELLTKQKVNVTDKFKNLAKYIPKDINLSTINYSSGNMTISGTTSNYNSISIFAANLQMSKEYKNSKIVNITTASGKDSSSVGKCQFNIVITE